MGPDEDGLPRLLLNGRPYFHTGVLDQGYWPDGLYTAPSDAALEADIALMKRMGFNMLRKHIKVEPLRWYYHCDRLGMLVWQDMPNGGGAYRLSTISLPLLTNRHRDDRDYAAFARQEEAGRREFSRELQQMVDAPVQLPVHRHVGARSTRAGASSTRARRPRACARSTRRAQSTTPAAGTIRARAT